MQLAKEVVKIEGWTNRFNLFFLPKFCVVFFNNKILLPGALATGLNVRARFPNYFDVVSCYTGSSVRLPVPSYFVFLRFGAQLLVASLLFRKFFKLDFPYTTAFFNNLHDAILLTAFGYYRILQYIGFRHRQRRFRYPQVLRGRFGYNRRVWFKCPDDLVFMMKKYHPKKRGAYFFSFFPEQLDQLMREMYSMRPASRYKGRGLNFKEMPMILHQGKKTLW